MRDSSEITVTQYNDCGRHASHTHSHIEGRARARFVQMHAERLQDLIYESVSLLSPRGRNRYTGVGCTPTQVHRLLSLNLRCFHFTRVFSFNAASNFYSDTSPRQNLCFFPTLHLSECLSYLLLFHIIIFKRFIENSRSPNMLIFEILYVSRKYYFK